LTGTKEEGTRKAGIAVRTAITMSVDVSYESTARFYDAAYAAMPSLGPDARFYERLAAEIGGPVLEVGCGTGRVLLPIATRGIECAGVDASPAMLDEFRRKPGAGMVALSCARMQSFDPDTACRGRMVVAY